MQRELKAIEFNKTWTVMPLLKGKHSIGCKWIYQVKYKSDGSIERYKARLVAKGYTQQEGLDFIETFSLVAKLVTVKVLLAIATKNNWSLVQLDVNNAFLNRDLFEEVYMDMPMGYSTPVSHSSPKREKLVCKLHKSIYGLKQASRQWFAKFSHVLIVHGFTQCKSDYSLFTKRSGPNFIALLVYVDDIIITDAQTQNIDSLKLFLQSQFKLKDLGALKYFLGLELARSRKGIPHLDAVHHLLRYHKSSPGQGLLFSSVPDFQLKAFTDVDWGACLDSRKSISGFCIFLGDSMISWKAKKQTNLSRSSAKAEYRALAATTSELVWVHQLLQAFQVSLTGPTLVFCDNQAAVHIASNPIFHERTKHIEIDYHFVHDKIIDGFLKLLPIRTQHQLVDVFTKALSTASIFALLSKMAVIDLHRPP
ncbi:Retrovirus-related Pol polyprotein from transposon TNT 1-94 [Melia azedarach]|uniref:Retrovirus-related Pol polyprotein from transposon TNT 1-94 n=1 Tax=Melia azedarach TaxID=155640 RepID=A0ACC1YHM4_MELAZ|nr:Retrovirus-related Pol polyprotein from transposon TNT 1-94 [Melia azedarach]